MCGHSATACADAYEVEPPLGTKPHEPRRGRLAVDRPVVRLAVVRPVRRLAVERPVARLAVERPVARLVVVRPALRFGAERAEARLAVERPVARLAVERPAGLRREPARLAVFLPEPPGRRFSIAFTSLPTSLRSDPSAFCASSSALLRRLIAAGSFAAGRFRLAVVRRRDAGFFAGGIADSPWIVVARRSLCGAYCLFPIEVAATGEVMSLTANGECSHDHTRLGNAFPVGAGSGRLTRAKSG
jgi:hypothetical protein